jgi:hypothetical protein
MTVIAEIACRPDDFLLGETLETSGETRVELEQVVPTAERYFPHLWVYGGDPDAFERRLGSDETVEEFALLDELDGQRLYRVEWAVDDRLAVQGLSDREVTVLSATGSRKSWQLKLRFKDAEALSEFHSQNLDRTVEVTLERLYDPIVESSRNQLTSVQRETLRLAYEEGYFDIPRRTTLVELGEQLGISDQSVSERLRRAQTNLIDGTLLADAGRDS